MGFDIENQSVDNFDGLYSVEYFSNDNLIEIPRNIKPERYSIIHTINNEKLSVTNDEQLDLLKYFFKDDKSDLYVQDIIVGEKVENKNNKEDQENKIKSDKDDEESILVPDSENEIIELLE